MMFEPRSRNRLILGFSTLIVLTLLWLPGSDVVALVVKQRPVLLGRYSRGHFGVLLLITPLLLGLSALLFSRIRTLRELVVVYVMVTLSTVTSILVIVVASGWAMGRARYVEEVVNINQGDKTVNAAVRHRPPNQFYKLIVEDRPEQRRSYPDAPAGYPEFPIELTVDKFGFRNKDPRQRYPIVAVGDSFTAGSEVDDGQMWSALLAKDLQQDIYNLGVSGSGPYTYLNNFSALGYKFAPQLVIFMLYEGNDFKYEQPRIISSDPARQEKSLLENIEFWGRASPVVKGLNRLSSELLEKIGSDLPIPGYHEKAGWMPIPYRYAQSAAPHYYAFQPKRLAYLVGDDQSFKNSSAWAGVRGVLENMHQLSKQQNFRLLLVYAPSKPHVVLPLVENQVPADQLHTFLGYSLDQLPAATQLKRTVFENLDAQQQVFFEFCREAQLECLSLTEPLRNAMTQGQQVYYTYDQHWTPEGNQVTAESLAGYLSQTQ